MIIETLKTSINQALQSIGIENNKEIHLEHPNDLSHGDFATNVAMTLAKDLGKNPREIAESIVKALNEQRLEMIQDLEVAGPGFINICLADGFFAHQVSELLSQGDRVGESHVYDGKKVLVEHSSSNLFKPFHVGHMMNNTVGESMARLCKLSGADVTVIAYPSDVSLGIGKAVWQFLEYGVEKIDEFETLADKMTFLGKCYSEGTKAYDENPELEARVREITQDVYENRQTEALAAYQIGRDLNLEYVKQMTTRLGSTFDGFIFESEAGVVGKQIVRDNVPNVYAESDGAVIYEGEQDGLHTRVFINKDGNPTYEAKDTGLISLKFDRYSPDMSIIVTDNQQGEYFKVMLAAFAKVDPKSQGVTKHVMHGRMKFKGQKMSSRLGNTPLASEMLDIVHEEVQERATEDNLSQKKLDAIAISAIKFAVLRTQAGKDINFDPETSLSFEGDSGPYLQYTSVRCNSILNKAKEAGYETETNRPDNWETTSLEKYLYRFPEIVEQSILELHPHHIATYAIEVAQYYNSWYAQDRVLDESDAAMGYKLALVTVTKSIIDQCLYLLGIETPEKM